MIAGLDMAPSVALFGSYFPAWLISLCAAVIATVILRLVLIRAGIDDILRWRVPTYMSLALSLTFLFSLVVFGR